MHYEIKPPLMERPAKIENAVGVKWYSAEPVKFVNMIRQFGTNWTS